MDPLTMLFIGASAIGAISGAKAKKQEAKAREAQLQQEAQAALLDAKALGMEALGLRSDAEGVRQQGRLTLAEADASDYNALLGEQDAAHTRQQYAENERRFRVKSFKERGSIRAHFGAGGAVLSGTALDLLEEAAANHELDALTIRYEGDVKAIGYENEAKLNRFRSATARQNAATIFEKATFVDEQADFTDAKADEVAGRFGFYMDQSKRAKKVGTYSAVGEIASGAATLIGKVR